jgi:hypothetical protein
LPWRFFDAKSALKAIDHCYLKENTMFAFTVGFHLPLDARIARPPHPLGAREPLVPREVAGRV